MILVGKQYSVNAKGERISTLHVTDEFKDYYKNPEAGRGCEGQRVDTIYVGTFDVSHLKVGMSIEIFYDKAIITGKSTFQPIKRIEVIK